MVIQNCMELLRDLREIEEKIEALESVVQDKNLDVDIREVLMECFRQRAREYKA